MIVLVNPTSAKWKHRLPMSILSLAALLEGRYSYEIVDGNFEADLEATLTRTIQETNAQYLGITVMPGPQLMQAIPITQRLKKLFPQLTVVWGGYFPSLHADVVLQSGFVDFVVRGQGELSFLELIDTVERGASADHIPGLSFVRKGEVIHNAKRPVTDPNTLPPMPYHRVDMKRYIGKTYLGTRTMTYHSSFGCPFLCGFCAVAAIYKSRWVGKRASSVVDEILWFKDQQGAKALDIIPEFSFVLGTPSDDGDGQIERDIRYIRRIKEINAKSEIVIYVFSPVFFDDADLLQKSRAFGFEFPNRLVEWLQPQWTSFDLRKQPLTPWLKPRHLEQISN